MLSSHWLFSGEIHSCKVQIYLIVDYYRSFIILKNSYVDRRELPQRQNRSVVVLHSCTCERPELHRYMSCILYAGWHYITVIVMITGKHGDKSARVVLCSGQTHRFCTTSSSVSLLKQQRQNKRTRLKQNCMYLCIRFNLAPTKYFQCRKMVRICAL